ncbi:MAG: proline--tRNA ligase [Myxococcota bacterium]
MRISRYLFRSFKEIPSDAQVISHQLMIRGGMIKKLAAGIYTYMPLLLRTIRKIENIVREELNKAGAVELLMPIVLPAELWIESGRWNYYGAELLRFKDRKGADFCLGPTHEEVITDIARQELKSYKDLPKNLYQIQTKFRDEARPRFGLMRGREFIMKDAYSFHTTEEDAKREYWNMYDTYTRIFKRCGLRFRAVSAATGNIGGTLSHEFQVLAESGEDEILACNSCEYAANVEMAASFDIENPSFECAERYIEVYTPDRKTVEEVTEFLRLGKERLIKTIIYIADNRPYAFLIRGDYDINEAKVRALLKCDELRLADDEEVMSLTGAPVGFAGPIGLKVDIYADNSIRGLRGAVVGANKRDTHLKDVDVERDIENIKGFYDIRFAKEGEICPVCKKGKYERFRGIEVGQVFYLGTKYSSKMNAEFLDRDGNKKPMIMGCYGIGIGRTAAAAIEQYHDENGIIWPMPIAPFEVHLLAIGTDSEEVVKRCEDVYKVLLNLGIEVLYDDRDERPGVLFKDADLIGIPIRVSVSKKSIEKQGVEVKLRREKDSQVVPFEKFPEEIKRLIEAEYNYYSGGEGGKN